MKGLLAIVLLVLALVPGPARAQCAQDPAGGAAAGGVALLIGVSGYRPAPSAGADDHWIPLGNAVHDVEQVCAALSDKGYRVLLVRDPTFAQLDDAVFRFEQAAAQADRAIVYYAGHGFEFEGEPYIVPVDAPRESRSDRLIGDFMPVSRLLDALGAARGFGLILMDACRTRAPVVQIADAPPQAGRPGNVGLFTVPGGAVIFSTVTGRPALDEAPAGSPLSPFASSVIDALSRPGLELSDFYAELHEEVVQLTEDMPPQGPQYPALYKVSPRKIYLVDPPVIQPVAVPAAPPRAAAGPAGDGAATRGPRLDLPPLARLATVDEPRLIREVIGRYTMQQLVEAGAAGDPVAQYLVGYAYHLGIGLKQDLAEARRWLELAAAQDHPAGLTELAYFLQERAAETDPGPHRDALAARALALYGRAAGQGYAKAQSHLAYALWQGSLGPADPARALELWQAASQAGHVYATFALAAYDPARKPAAVARLRAIAAGGDAEGDSWLCELAYSEGHAPTDAQACERAALNGYYGARAIYAHLLAEGDGVARDPRQARYWAQLALSNPELAKRPDLVALADGLAH